MAISTTDKELLNYFNQLDELQPEKYNQEIDEAMEQFKKGEVYTHEEVVKMSKDW